MGTKSGTRAPQPGPAPAPGVADRILTAATDLFYREGVRAVGIQRVIDEAGIAKASLYAHYASKDELVAACMTKHGAAARTSIARRLAQPELDARGRLLALFDTQIENIEGPDFRGCPFLNANSEIADPNHPAKQIIAAQRTWLHALMLELVRDAGAVTPERVAATLVVLFDGALSSSLVDGTSTPAHHARWAAEQILDAHLPKRTRRKTDRRRADRARRT